VIVGESKWRHEITKWVVVIVIAAVCIHLAASLMVAELPALIAIGVVGLVIWIAVVIVRRQRNRW
jgi:hypothetical protein